jgi:hypothetical protein
MPLICSPSRIRVVISVRPFLHYVSEVFIPCQRPTAHHDALPYAREFDLNRTRESGDIDTTLQNRLTVFVDGFIDRIWIIVESGEREGVGVIIPARRAVQLLR